MNRLIVLCGLSLMVNHFVLAEEKSLSEALNNGADAKVVMHVVDQSGDPVSNACVRCGVWRSFASGGPIEEKLFTNGDGMCTVWGYRCTGIITWSVSKDGYYRSQGSVRYDSDGKEFHSVVAGRWLPWGYVKKITLKKQVSPCKLIVGSSSKYMGIRIPKFSQWLPFDLRKLDWLPPFGDGEYSDVVIFCEKKVANRINNFSFSMKVAFTNSYNDGFYVQSKDKESTFRTLHVAETNKVLKKIYEFSIKRNGAFRDVQELGDGEYIVFRTRTKTDDSGNLLSANYGVISGPFRMGSSSIYIEDSCFNPMPNDMNIEDGLHVRSEAGWWRYNDR